MCISKMTHLKMRMQSRLYHLRKRFFVNVFWVVIDKQELVFTNETVQQDEFQPNINKKSKTHFPLRALIHQFWSKMINDNAQRTGICKENHSLIAASDITDYRIRTKANLKHNRRTLEKRPICRHWKDFWFLYLVFVLFCVLSNWCQKVITNGRNDKHPSFVRPPACLY